MDNQTNKWESYYSRKFTPWDSHRPCSQLVTAFDIKINGGPPEGSEKDQIQERDEEEVEEGKEGKEGRASVIEKEDGRRASVISPTEIPPPPAAANAHVEPTLIEELEAKHEAMLQKQEGEEELSQIEGAENDMLLVFIGLVRGTYSHYRGRRGMSLEDAMQHYIDEKEPCQKDFMSRVSGRGMHESVVAMYSEKYETTFEENRARMVKDLTLLIAKDADDLERAQAELMRRDFENVSTKICPSFVVGNHESPSRWTCVELGCGTGSSGVYMAQQGCRVVGIDLIPHPLREASAKAVMSGVAKSCVWVNGNVFDLQGRALTFEGALKVLDRHIVGEGDWGVKGVVPLGVVLEESGAGVENGGDFDFVFDCQCFHVLREVQSETKAVNAIRSVLRPGGLLMVLTGNDNEPECGPAVLSLAQLKRPFSAAFDLEAVIETRFDRTHEYDKLEKSPLAWCGLFRKRLELDASKWQSVSDCWKDLLSGLRCSEGHRPGFDRLERSVALDENGIVRPFTVAVSKLRGKAAPVESWVNMLAELFEQMERDGTFTGGRQAKVVILQ